MDPRFLASTNQWRRQEQLRGLQANHRGTVALEVGPLANEGTLFDACCLALHPSETALAVGMAPFLGSGPSSVGLLNITESTATAMCMAAQSGTVDSGSESLGFSLAPKDFTSRDGQRGGDGGNMVRNEALVSSMRWIDLPHNASLSALEWSSGSSGSGAGKEGANALLMGSSRGRIFVCPQRPADILSLPAQSAAKIVRTLTVDDVQMPVASCAVQPTHFAATTTVRCIRRCPLSIGSNLVAAASGAGVYVWDLGADVSLPSLTVPINEDEPETAVCCAWASSSSIVAVGGVAGTCFLVDRRQGPQPAMILPCPSEFAVKSIDFSPVLPAAVLMASAKGVLTIADVRRPTAPLLAVDALQEMPVSARWMPHHPDLFASAGMDGTIKLWCLRSRPNYIVGCAQFSSAVSQMVVPRTYAQTRVVGLTADGQLCTTALTQSTMMAIAPNGLRKDDAYIAAQKGVPVSTPGADAKGEQRAEGLLYCRAMRPLMKAVLAAAKRREQRGDLDFALRVCSLVDSKTVPSMDVAQLCEQNASVSRALSALGVASTSPLEGPSRLLQDIDILSQRLPSTVALEGLKGYDWPDGDDPIRIEALKLNVTMRKLLNARETSLIIGGTQTMLAFLGRRPDLVETDVLVATTRFLLTMSRPDGVSFINRALGILMTVINGGGTGAGDEARAQMASQRCSHLTRALLLTASEPLITTNTSVNPKKIRRIHKMFLGNLAIAKQSVEAQLKVCDLAVKAGEALTSLDGTMRHVSAKSPVVAQTAKAIVAFVAKYQSEALNDESATSMGVFTWLGARPIMAYLRSLLVCDSTVAFMWTSQQLLDTYAQYGSGSSKAPIGAPPILKNVNDLVEEELSELAEEAKELSEDAVALGEAEEVSLRLITEAEDLLIDMHPFMLRTMRLAIECSNVAINSEMPDVPPLMKGIVDDISQAVATCCDGWVVLLSTLCRSRLTDKVSASCGPLLAELGESVASLRDEVALDNTCEHVIDTIINTCESFEANMSAASAGKKGAGKRR